ncbi:MAG: helix-turn-helix domain-containing protein [Phycisphaerales bacterium]
MGTRPQHAASYRRLRALLRTQREQAGLTIRALGAKLGKPYSFVSKTELGERRMDPMEFIAWCRACGADPAKAISELAN